MRIYEARCYSHDLEMMMMVYYDFGFDNVRKISNYIRVLVYKKRFVYKGSINKNIITKHKLI